LRIALKVWSLASCPLIVLALEINPFFVKALDRRAKAYETFGNYDEAIIGNPMLMN